MLGWRQRDRAQLAEQGKVVRDDPDHGDEAVDDGEDIDRAHLNLELWTPGRSSRFVINVGR